MSKARSIVVLLVLGVALAGALSVWTRRDRARAKEFVVFGPNQAGCAIVVPRAASGAELVAAKLLSETLAKAAGRRPAAFPIQREAWWNPWQRGIFVGATRHAGRNAPARSASPLERPVTYAAMPDRVLIHSRNREDAVIAASWFLEKQTGARWFMPGPLGEHVPRREALRLKTGESVLFTPGFVSRSLGHDDPVWAQRNRLCSLFDHGHSMSRIFQPADLQKEPELAPRIERQKFIPASASDGNWQPNIASDQAVGHAANFLRRELAQDPARLSVSLAMNDSIRYDQSVATTSRVAPLRYFRGRPDYSDLVFGFVNQVAAAVGRDFPDRYLTTYAYDWCEDTPRFRVEPNVVPYLTADRSQWFDPRFEEEDRMLIERWVRAGPKMVGLYDYYEGAPYLVPRPTLYAVARAIPFAYRAGVRAFYGEGAPNWGLDGPKLWLAAQLLWDPAQDPAALLDIYYREFWREAAPPMREFFELCDQAWLTQPLPSYWLKYYKDAHQYLLFPPALRQQLRTRLGLARAAAKSGMVAERVAFVAGAFNVAAAFCVFCETSDRLSRLGLRPTIDAADAMAALREYARQRAALVGAYESIREQAPLALHEAPLAEYLRGDPRARVARRLLLQATGPEMLKQLEGNLVGSADERHILAALRRPGREEAIDPMLQRVWLKPVFDSTTVEYVRLGDWRGHGEPWQSRFITMQPREGGQMIRYQGCKQETLSEWRPAVPGAIYVATAKVRGKVSPGNRTFLIVSYLDAKGQHVGVGSTDRLPVGDWSDRENELCVIVRAPKEAAQIGIGVRVLDQVNDDFADFAEISLRRLE